MMEAEIVIDRSPQTVWEYFTEPSHWEKWWGGAVKSAEWRDGGEVEWALGGSSPVRAIIPSKMLEMAGSFGMTIVFTFRPALGGKTLVRIRENWPSGGAQFTDGGASRLAKLHSNLGALKKCVEKDTRRVSFFAGLFGRRPKTPSPSPASEDE